MTMRSDDRGENPASKHPGHGLGPEARARRIGGGKTIGLMRRPIEAAAKRSAQQQPKGTLKYRRAGDHAGQGPENRSGLQRKAPAAGFRQHANRQCPDPHPEHHDADGKRRQRRIGRQHRADDSAGRGDNGTVAAGERLRHRKDERVARGEPVVGKVNQGFSNGSHGQTSIGIASSNGRSRAALLRLTQGSP